MKVVAVRHLKDQDDLGYDLDAPLVVGQIEEAKIIASEVSQFAQMNGMKNILFVHSGARRSVDTARLVGGSLPSGMGYRLEKYIALSSLGQGEFILPADYQVGDHYQPFPDAWDALCYEAYTKQNYDYQFGNPIGSKAYPGLEGNFTSFGESITDCYVRQLRFLNKLLRNEVGKDDEMIVLSTHCLFFYLLLDVLEMAADIKAGSLQSVTPSDLPNVVFRYYNKVVEDKFPQVEGFGVTMEIDLSPVKETWLPEVLEAAEEYFTQRQGFARDSVQSKCNSHDNDYSGLSAQFEQLTGRALDGISPLAHDVEFPGISVVIPYYWSSDSMGVVLDSINQQALTDAEMQLVQVLVVNDSPNDSSVYNIKSNQYRFDLQVVKLEENLGRSGARNAGAKLAKHECLMFIDSDILLTRHALKEHAVRCKFCPEAIYTSLITNWSKLDPKVMDLLASGAGLDAPEVWDEYRVHEINEPVGSDISLYPVVRRVEFEILKETRNFRDFGFGRVVGMYDLPCMYATYIVSSTKTTFEQSGGFSSAFNKWGLEDTHSGAVMIAQGAYLIPVLSCGGYHLPHGPRSGSDEIRLQEMSANVQVYWKEMKKVLS